jgi:xanthine dehydrogenase molybdenum-binding subunit
MTSKDRSYQVIGTSPMLRGALEKVTGRAQYAADIRQSRMLYGAILRSSHAHARILTIDTTQVEAYPGVKAVVTAADLPQDRHTYLRDNILARDKVLYQGHAIAAVAAENFHTALEALKLIQVTYEVLPPVLHVLAAMQPDAPVLLENLRTNELGTKGNQPTNIASHSQVKRGDLEKGFTAAVHVVEREFDTATIHQGYIEPHNALAVFSQQGEVTIWCSTQGAFGVREEVAEILDIPISRIRVVPMEIGGGFGGKNNVYLDPVAVLLSKKSGSRPVKLTMNYREVLSATGPTSASVIRVKMGVDAQGYITAAQASLFYEAGAYPAGIDTSGANVIFSPYRLENVQVDSYDVVVNKPHVTALRAPGGTNAVFAAETVVDELCEKLGMDPIEFRMINGVKEGDQHALGPVFPSVGYLETLQAAKNHPHYSAPLPGSNRGRGIASGIWMNYGGMSAATASVNNDGSVSLMMGSVDLSGTRTTIAMQLAETLGIPLEMVRSGVTDTDMVSYTEGTYGSRTTFATGMAAHELGLDLKHQLIARAAKLMEVALDEVNMKEGVFYAGDKKIDFNELASRLGETGSQVQATAAVRAEHVGPGSAVHIVDVEVDPETGKVQVLRYTACQDVGKAVHPTAVEGQIQGGTVHGIGWGLFEGYFYNQQGQLMNASLLDYRLPTSLDVPFIDPVLVEVPFPGHPYGVRGVGEAPILPPPAALANAIYQAVGVRLQVLPMSPDKIVSALWAKDKA